MSADDPYIGEIIAFAGNFAPVGWALCNGQILTITSNTALFSLLGTTYGGDGRTTFALPNLQSSVLAGAGNGPGLSLRTLGEVDGAETVALNSTTIPSHTHTLQAGTTADAPVPQGRVAALSRAADPAYGPSTGADLSSMNAAAVSPSGGSQAHLNLQPYLVLNYIICTQGIFPTPVVKPHAKEMLMGSTPYIGDIMLFAGNFAPAGWAFCNGQLMSIAQNETLFQLIGTTYGGDGVSTFGLPNLQGRVPIAQGTGAGLSPRVMGQILGEENHTLTVNEIPGHTHTLNAQSVEGDAVAVSAALPAKSGVGDARYSATPSGSMNAAAIANAGNSLPHNNLMPMVCINYCIALVGIFPTQS